MKHYKSAMWVIFLFTLLLTVVITFAAKIIFTPLISEQQKQVTETLRLHETPVIFDRSSLNKLTEQAQFDYIKVSNQQLMQPLVYQKKPAFTAIELFFNIPPIVVPSDNSDQILEVKINNNQLLGRVQQILLAIYSTLIALFIMISVTFGGLFKKTEATLTQKITEIKGENEEHQNTINEQQEKIESLTQQANMDNLTGLDNRNAFRKALMVILGTQGEPKNAILSIIRASELMSINSRQGFQQGDLYLENLSGIITRVASQYKNTSIYRINGSDFALIAEDMSISDAKRLAEELKTQFDQYQVLHELDSMAYNGISSIISGQLPEQVLARTDMALAKAQTEGVNSWSFQYHNDVDSLFGEKHWHVIVEGIIAQKGITLLHQPILAIHKDMKGYEEIFTRFITDNDQTIPTDTVFAMAQRIDKIVKLEQIIIEKVIAQCRNKKDHSSRWGVNISSTAIQNSSFIVWLERLLLREPDIAASIIFEMEEELLDINLVASKRVFDMLRRTGTRSAISNFGKGIGSFSLFKTLKPDFVKIDTSLISDIERDNANQQFVRMIIDVAHRMGCRVIAEGVEHLEQKQILETMYVDGIQGFLIARPTPLK